MTLCWAAAQAAEWSLVATYTKEPLFLEGIEFFNDEYLLESDGLYGKSEIQLLQVSDGDTSSIGN